MIKNKKNSPWWGEEYGFFGDLYMEGDNSKEGYLAKEELSIDKRTKRDIDGVVNLLKLKKGADILDIPCGYGRHSIELAKRDFHVIGSDVNSLHLSKAKKRAAENNLKIKFKKEDMRKVKYSDEFDAVINMCYSFGFFETDKENQQVLDNFYNALKGGGKFLMETDVNLPYVRAGNFKEHETRSLMSGNQLKIIKRLNEETKRMEGSWTITKPDGEELSRDYSVRVYEKDEFIDMCLAAGFSKCHAYSDWKGSDYSEKAQLIIFVAEK